MVAIQALFEMSYRKRGYYETQLRTNNSLHRWVRLCGLASGGGILQKL